MELTPASLKKLCKERKQYISSPELNDVLHLQCKGITRLENLQAYTGLRTLYLEQNAISVIEGLELLVNLRCLYLGKNIIDTIGDGLSLLTALETLDLSENCISAISGLDTLQQLKTLNVSGNRIRSTADLSALSLLGGTLTTLDLASNKIDDPAVLDLLTAIPLSLLRLNGNPVVSNTRHYRKIMLTRFPTLNYLDESPCFPNDRRLAAAFVEGGLDVERAERDTIRKEEEALREKHRQAFDDMVATARANPPLPHDPMRFRAVPPGESDSSDEEGLPLSTRHAKAQRRQQRQLVQQARRASTSSSSTPSSSQLPPTLIMESPAAEESVGAPEVPDDASSAANVHPLLFTDTINESADLTQPADSESSNLAGELQTSRPASSGLATAATETAGVVQPVFSEHPPHLRAQSLVQFGPPQTRPLPMQSPPTQSPNGSRNQAADSAAPALQQEDFRSELRDRANARAGARAEATASTLDGESPAAQGRFSNTYRQQLQQEQQQERLAGGNGGPYAHDLDASEIATEDSMPRTIAGPEGRFAPFVIPRVWGTPNYRRLWDMAVAAGEGQQLQQEQEEEEERNSRELLAEAEAAEGVVRDGSVDSVLENGGGSSSDSDDPLQDGSGTANGFNIPASSAGDAPSIGDSAMNWIPVAGVGSANAALDRTDLDSARDGNSNGSPVRHLGMLVPAEDLDSARGVEPTDEDLDSAHSFHGLDQDGSISTNPPDEIDGSAFEGDAMEASSTSDIDSQEAVQQQLGMDALLSNGHSAHGGFTTLAQSDSDAVDTSDSDEMGDDGVERDERAVGSGREGQWSQSQHEVEVEEEEVDLFARYSIISVGRGGAAMPAAPINPALAATHQPHVPPVLQARHTATHPASSSSSNAPLASLPANQQPSLLQRSGSGELSAHLLTSQSQRLHSLYSTVQTTSTAPLAPAVPGSHTASRPTLPSGSALISSISAMAAVLRASSQQVPLVLPVGSADDSPPVAITQNLPSPASTLEAPAAAGSAAGISQGSSIAQRAAATAATSSGDVVSPRHATMMGRNSRLVSAMSDSARVIHPPTAWETEDQEAEVFNSTDLGTSAEMHALSQSDSAGALFVEDLESLLDSREGVSGGGAAAHRLEAQRATSPEGYARSDSAWGNEQQQRPPIDLLFRAADSTPSGPWFTSPTSVGQELNLLEQARALVGTMSGSTTHTQMNLSGRGSVGLPNDAYLQLAETMQAPEVLAQARAVMSSPNSRSTSMAQLSASLADGYRSIHLANSSDPIQIPRVDESDESAAQVAGEEQQLSLLEQARLVLRSPSAATSPFFTNPRLSLSIQEDDDANGSPTWARASSRERASNDRSSPRVSPGPAGGSGLRMRVNSLSVVDFDEPSPMSGAVSSISCPAPFDSLGSESGGSGRPGSLLSAARALVRGDVTHVIARLPSPVTAATTETRGGEGSVCTGEAASAPRAGSLAMGRVQSCDPQRDSAADEVMGAAAAQGLSAGQGASLSASVDHGQPDVSTLFELD